MVAEKPPTSPMPSVQPSSQLRLLVDQRVRALLAAGLLVGGERQRDRAAPAGRRRAPAPVRRTRSWRRSPSCRRRRGPRRSRPGPRRRTGRPSSRAARPGTTSRWPCNEQPVRRRWGRPSARRRRCGPGDGSNSSDVDADLVQQRGHVLGRHPLPRARVVAVVGGVDPDQVAADLDDFGLGCVAPSSYPHLAPRTSLAGHPFDYVSAVPVC